MREKWVDIKNYEGLYQISNLGRVKSVLNDIIMKPKLEKNGYYRVGIRKNKIIKTFAVHRLVAEAFIPNPDNLPQIDHIDRDKYNNSVTNLRWCTGLQNTKWACDKKVYQYTKDGLFIKEYESITEAAKDSNCSITAISNAARNKILKDKNGKYYVKKSAAGYMWSVDK